MAKSFECRHGGIVCDARVIGETEDEVLAGAVEHAQAVHHVDLTQAKTLTRFARTLIREA